MTRFFSYNGITFSEHATLEKAREACRDGDRFGEFQVRTRSPKNCWTCRHDNGSSQCEILDEGQEGWLRVEAWLQEALLGDCLRSDMPNPDYEIPCPSWDRKE